jgi:predicted transcriptional regulator
MVPVTDDDGNIIGVVTEGNISNKIISGRALPNQTVSDAGVIYKTFRKLNMNATLADLAGALDFEPYALIITEQRCFAGRKKKRTSDVDVNNGHNHSGAESSEHEKETMTVIKKSVVSGIVTRIDLLEFISKGSSD